MKKSFKRILTLLIVACFTASLMMQYATAAGNEVLTDCKGDCEYCPSIIIPGLFQSKIILYDENGNVAVNSEGEEYKQPFFLEPSSEIVKLAVKKAAWPIIRTLITQRDKNGEMVEAVSDVVVETLAGRIKSDETGKTVHNVQPDRYGCSFEKCTPEQQKKILDTIPIKNYLDIAGEDHMYFLSFFSFGNIGDIADELYDLIQQVKEETGHDKVNLVPISQGGSITNMLLETHPDVVDDLNRIVYVIPALDGSYLIGDLFTHGLIDDDDALYGYFFPDIMDGTSTSYLVSVALRLLPNEVVNNLLDVAVDKLINEALRYSTCMWALVPSSQYEICAEKYLSDEKLSEIKRQTDIYYEAQKNSDANILKAIEAGVEVFDISNYDFELYRIVDSWDDVNADGIIQLDSTSMGATSYGVGVELPEGYVQQNTHCDNPEHNHIDPYNVVDASTGLLPDHTFYFHGQDHESSGANDVIMRLVVELLVNEDFKDVYSMPEKFPQFNEWRDSGWMKHLIPEMQNYDLTGVSEEDKQELKEALADAEAAMECTTTDPEIFQDAYVRLKAIRDKIMHGEPTAEELAEREKEAKKEEILTKVFKFVSEKLYEHMGGKGFSD